jgi:hypothetical protein
MNTYTESVTLKEMADLSYVLGKYYGYPTCCIVEFCSDIVYRRDAARRNIDGSGFIPCTNHFNEVKSNKKKLSDLINKNAAAYKGFIRYSERKPVEAKQYLVRYYTDEYHANRKAEYLEFNGKGFLVEHDEIYNLEWYDELPQTP